MLEVAEDVHVQTSMVTMAKTSSVVLARAAKGVRRRKRSSEGVLGALGVLLLGVEITVRKGTPGWRASREDISILRVVPLLWLAILMVLRKLLGLAGEVGETTMIVHF